MKMGVPAGELGGKVEGQSANSPETTDPSLQQQESLAPTQKLLQRVEKFPGP